MILYRFITGWWIESAMPEGIEDLLIKDLDTNTMDRMIQVFHEHTGGYDFKEFKKHLTRKGVHIIDVPQVDIMFTDKDRWL